MTKIFISAAHKSSGKTTVSIGLCAALTAAGRTVQSFKKGPDYIDPLWLQMATGRPCFNLDYYTMSHAEIEDTFRSHSKTADVALIEGNKGLYDGLDLDGSNSNAALAKHLEVPVILVLDARGMTRGIAPLILGYQSFDEGVNIRGVILNQLGGSRHESKLRNVIEHYTDVEVIGAVHRSPELDIEERHLGLVPSNEQHAAGAKIMKLAETIADSVDLDALSPVEARTDTEVITDTSGTAKSVRIGIIRNAAFGFYYADDLSSMQEAGAELIEIDNISDTSLPDIDGLFIGGGFPETHLEQLTQNSSMRSSIRSAIEDGLPVYAECGGLMYLSRTITWNGCTAEMVGIIPGDIVMEERPQGRGYVQLEETGNGLWSVCRNPVIHAHEFHYSRFKNLHKDARFAYKVRRGFGIDGSNDGYIYKNLMACYSHQRSTGGNHWTSRFIEFVEQNRNRNRES